MCGGHPTRPLQALEVPGKDTSIHCHPFSGGSSVHRRSVESSRCRFPSPEPEHIYLGPGPSPGLCGRAPPAPQPEASGHHSLSKSIFSTMFLGLMLSSWLQMKIWPDSSALQPYLLIHIFSWLSAGDTGNTGAPVTPIPQYQGAWEPKARAPSLPSCFRNHQYLLSGQQQQPPCGSSALLQFILQMAARGSLLSFSSLPTQGFCVSIYLFSPITYMKWLQNHHVITTTNSKSMA